MKYILIITLIVIGFTTVYAQPGPGPAGGKHRWKDGLGDNPKAYEKIEQLEKLKLIEILDMDEETTLKFFSRRKDFKEKFGDINRQIDDLIGNTVPEIRKDGKKDDSYYKNFVSEMLRLQKEAGKTREEFINSLYGLLSPLQVAKYIVFERRFREELKELLLEGRN